jgi:aspartyl-tRNA(Asn)/glutamyl-tRNA(Gln) amidotransferase subunit B
VNSFRFIREALEYEIARQIDVIESGGKITQETRLYNSNEGKTYSMRSKEQAHDYRYFPEPDLLPLVVDEKWKAEIAKTLPELPGSAPRAHGDYGITEYDAQVLTFRNRSPISSKRPRKPRRIPSAWPTWCRAN